MCSATQVYRELVVPEQLREGQNTTRLAILDVCLELVELFPRLLIDLQVKFLLAADLVQLEDLFLMHAELQLLQGSLLLDFSLIFEVCRAELPRVQVS